MPSILQFLKSKTVWAGILTGAVGVVQYATPFIPPQYVPVALAGAGLLQVALRTVTNKPLAEK